MFSVTLACGAELCYEAQSFVPAIGATVPCRNHGYCSVEMKGGRRVLGSRPSPLPRATPRTQCELVEWMRHEPVTTIHALKRRRFTLRIIAAAQRDGLIDVDF